MIRAIGIATLLDDYVLYRSLADSSTYQIDRSARLFEEWLGRAASIGDFEDKTISRFLAQLPKTHAQRSVANHRTNLLCLWRFAADEKLCSPPHRVRKATRPDPCPVAWTADELRRIVARCGKLEGTFPNGASRSLYCSTLVKFCYETGLRRSDVWRLRRDSIRLDGSMAIRQQKTRHTHTPRIRPETLAAIGQLPGEIPLACPYRSTGQWYRFWREEVTRPAGVRHGALQQLRRSGASHLAIDHPEAVQRYLGHRTASMQRHYVDESIASPQQHLPPEISPAERLRPES